MALYRATLRQAIGGGLAPDAYKWSNVFYLEASSLLFASEILTDIWADDMRPAFNGFVYAYEAYVSDLVPETVNFTTVPIDQALQRGTFGLSEEAVNFYTSAVAYRVDFPVAGGLPSRKWFRPGLVEGSVAPGGKALSNSTWQSALNAMFAALVANSAIKDESGSPWTGYVDRGILGKRLGKLARNALPTPPAFG